MKIVKLCCVVVLAVHLAIVSGLWAQEAPVNKTILTNCNLIDCTGEPIKSDMAIVIEGNRIAEIRSGPFLYTSDGDVRVIDLKGAYVLPGLWNMHVHLSDLLPDVHDMLGQEATLPATLRAGRNAMDALKYGFTGLRIVGERDYIDLAWRDAFNSGVYVGPRIFAAGKIVTPGFYDSDEPDWPVEIFANGPDEIRNALEENIARGIDFVKIFAPALNDEEMALIIGIAHEHGLKVTAHSGGESAHRAVMAGVDCLEHGTMITDETIQLMAEKGVFLCPTVVCNLSEEYIQEREARLAKLGFSDQKDVVEGRILVAHADERSPRAAARHREIIVTAAKAGVKILSGSDSNPLDELGILEIEQLVLSGLTEMQALQAATRNCAEICGVLDKLGTIEQGKLADLIVVAENPLEDISNLRKLKMVFKDGKSVDLSKEEGQTSFWNLYFK
ncbi:MAG: amidohydrolase family protein [Candidatus Aminicenantes bacterium]|nr:amidohydrolase family protein [Candidatus Aminicenantes bacterium]